MQVYQKKSAKKSRSTEQKSEQYEGDAKHVVHHDYQVSVQKAVDAPESAVSPLPCPRKVRVLICRVGPQERKEGAFAEHRQGQSVPVAAAQGWKRLVPPPHRGAVAPGRAEARTARLHGCVGVLLWCAHHCRAPEQQPHSSSASHSWRRILLSGASSAAVDVRVLPTAVLVLLRS